MAKAAGKKKRPGLTRRMARSTMRVGMLATAVLVGRKTAGAGKARDGQGGGGPAGGGPEAPGGLGAAAGGGPGASHETDPREVEDDDAGRRAGAPQQIPPKGWKDIAKRTAKEVKQDQVPLLGAGVAFYILLSLFPAIIAGVSLYGLVADPQTVRDQIDRLAQRLSPETAKLVGDQIEQITSGAGGALGVATVIGILTALWSASSGMKALITGVNLAYDESESRKFVKLRGRAIVMTLGAMGLLAVAGATIVGFPPIANDLPVVVQWVVSILRFLLLAALLIVGLAALYRFAPDRDEPRWTWVTWGSGVATVLWIVASIGFSIYANSFGNYNKTYGALAGVIILMFWLYLTAVIVLVGAELNTEMELQTARDTTKGPEQPMGERGGHAADHVAESPAGGS
ncbi:MAG TPA: YihY/virulence factor BrkB family protein [Actinomycetota bacterium]|nr:YihY/virulence factor BrkB family protein [Actinomycetota bacterium]